MEIVAEEAGFSTLAENAKKRLSEKITAAVRKAGEETKEHLRSITRPVLGQRVAYAWRLDLFPPPPKTSLHPASRVRTKTPKIIDAWSRGTPIRAVNGRFLAIPTKNAQKYGRRRPTPALYRERGWDLRIVKTKRGNFIIVGVAGGFTKKGRMKRPTKRQETGVFWVHLFNLVRSVFLPKVFDLKRESELAKLRLRAALASIR